MNGEKAIAHAALQSGIKLATGYPGAPGTGVIDALLTMTTPNHALKIEWSVNEKVAVEKAIGASISGQRTLVSVKSVGINVMIDPLMVVNLTPLPAGLVIIVGDDPGAYGSQNDQDSRLIAPFLSIPMLEPASPQDGYDLTLKCFEWSEETGLPIMLRITRNFATCENLHIQQHGIIRNETQEQTFASNQFVPGPTNAVRKSIELNRRLFEFEKIIESEINYVPSTRNQIGIIACGNTFQKLNDIIETTELGSFIDVLKLQSIYPLPINTIKKFLTGKAKILILEENKPMIINMIRQFTSDINSPINFESLAKPGELFRWEIEKALRLLVPKIGFPKKYVSENQNLEQPSMTSNCSDCRYDDVFDLLDKGFDKVGKIPLYFGDPGCLVTLVERLHTKYAMGGAVSTASGYVNDNRNEIPVALFGDSSFFHSTIPAICDAAYHQKNLLLVLLNNYAAKTTGNQPHPGSGRDIHEEPARALSYKDIVLSCGVDHYISLKVDDPKDELIKQLQSIISKKGLRFILFNC